jgi:hypothetical protein
MKGQLEQRIENFVSRKYEEFPELKRPVDKIIEDWR